MHIILISSTNEDNSGWGTLTHNHCLTLFNNNQKFTLLLPKKSKKINTAYSDNIKYILPTLPLSFNSIKGIMQLPLLYKKIKINYKNPVIVHSLLDFPYAFLGWRLAKQIKCPFIFSAVGTYSVLPFTKFIDRILFLPVYKSANAIISISNFTAQKIKEVSGYARKIEVIYLPVISHREQNESSSLDTTIPKGLIILSIGPLKARKGMDILIKALSEIIKIIPNVQLVIVASYGNIQSFNKLAVSLGVKNNLHILQDVNNNLLSSLLENCDVFAMTPRYINHEFEGYGLVYLEAGLHKKPVVGTFSGGVPEAVINNKTGILVPENDINATAEAIIKILKDKSLAENLGNNGYELAKERNWDDYINKIIKIYESR